MKSIVFGLFICCSIVLFSCDSTNSDDYRNKAVQTVTVGDEVLIYYTTNSCCTYCSPNKDNLQHLEYIGERTVSPYPSDCDGCNQTSALVFKAKSVGTDTIRGCVHAHSIDCSDTLDMEEFVVAVR